MLCINVCVCVCVCHSVDEGLQLGYVGLRFDPVWLTGFWGAEVVPMW